MAQFQVTCITKPNPDSPHEHITHVGGPGWVDTVGNIIQFIDSGTHDFYVKDAQGNTSWVGVVRPNDERLVHIRTYADGEYNNNLLSLVQCPR